jgi:hypothetical protein
MEHINPYTILENLLGHFKNHPTMIVQITTRSQFNIQNNYTIKMENGTLLFESRTNQGEVGNIVEFVTDLSNNGEVINKIYLIMVDPYFHSPYQFTIYLNFISYYGCDETIIKRKMELFQEYTNRMKIIRILKDFIQNGLFLLKLKADRIAFESENQERSEQKASIQQKLNDALVQQLFKRKSLFGSNDEYLIDYNDSYNFTCDGENEFVIWLNRMVDVTMPKVIKNLKSDLVDVFSKIPNNKEVLPQFINLMKSLLDMDAYKSFFDSVIKPVETLLNTSMSKTKKTKEQLIEETTSLREATKKLSFGNKRSLLRRKNKVLSFKRSSALKVVNSEIKYLL